MWKEYLNPNEKESSWRKAARVVIFILVLLPLVLIALFIPGIDGLVGDRNVKKPSLEKIVVIIVVVILLVLVCILYSYC